ncbi:MAG: protein translocase subunit SecD [Alphaproteobacteria bacterium GM7ARS4]|nr:protein translocase subunit SecD [Alphaproteobacteria bacterium GM7ARS4]
MNRPSLLKTLATALVILLGGLFALPNMLDDEALRDVPSFLPKQRVNLGLDLQGGAHLLLQVGVDDVIKERLESLLDDVRRTLRQGETKVGYRGLVRSSDHVGFTLTDPASFEDARALILERDIAGEYDIVRGEADGAVRISFTPVAKRDILVHTIEQSIEVVRSRIDALGTSEPIIQSEGAERILVQLPGGDPDRVKALLGQTAKLSFRMLDESVPVISVQQGRVQSGSEVVPAYRATSAEPYYLVRRKVDVSGERLKNATATFDALQGGYVVSLAFDNVGTRQFAKITKDNVGKRFAVVLDGRVITAPVINEPIPGGTAIISGSFSPEEANNLALLLRAGALPAPLTVIEERSVGPSLGADSIEAGKIASVIGLLLVIAFMILVYGVFGLFAVTSLLTNLLLIFGALSFLQATLTLPGIAGIVLTIGMAVDANVLIFERIREEMRGERTPINAVSRGYERALRTIIDANLTTLFAALFLYIFGSGPIRGFAVTLSLGILTSMFTAITLTRFIMTTWLYRSKARVLPL